MGAQGGAGCGARALLVEQLQREGGCRPQSLWLWYLENGVFSMNPAVRSSDGSQAGDL